MLFQGCCIVCMSFASCAFIVYLRVLTRFAAVANVVCACSCHFVSEFDRFNCNLQSCGCSPFASFCSIDIYVSSRCSLFNISMYFFVYLVSSGGHSSRPPTPPYQQPARPLWICRRWPITLPTSATSTSTPRSRAAAWRWDPTPTSRCTRPRPPMCPSKPSTTW